MKRNVFCLAAICASLSLSACEKGDQPVSGNASSGNALLSVTLTFGTHTLTATLEDNATARAFADMLPVTLPMMDLYGREMCYRFPDALPTDNARTRGYEVGEIVYYPPMHSFVIMYKQNGERFQMQSIGRIEGDVSLFDGIGDIDVSFSRQTPTATPQLSANSTSVTANGQYVCANGNGALSMTIYDAGGTRLYNASGKDSVTIRCQGVTGVLFAEIRDGQGNVTIHKLMLK